jgi:hypothetical protein
MATTNEYSDSVKTLIWGVIWILGACWFWYYLAGNPLDELALIRRAQVAPGFIVDTWEDAESGDEGGTHWSHGATYTYRIPDGREFTQSAAIRSGRLKEEFQDLQQPYPIEVEYLPDNPTVSRIKGDGCESIMGWLLRKIGLGSLLLALLASPGIALLRNGVRDIRRLRTFTATQPAKPQ